MVHPGSVVQEFGWVARIPVRRGAAVVDVIVEEGAHELVVGAVAEGLGFAAKRAASGPRRPRTVALASIG